MLGTDIVGKNGLGNDAYITIPGYPSKTPQKE
jgi:hypothetical protein